MQMTSVLTREAALARRLIWWKPPAEALRQPERLLAQVMKLGTWEDITDFDSTSVTTGILGGRKAPP